MHTLTNDVGQTSKENRQYDYQTATKCNQCPRGLISKGTNIQGANVQGDLTNQSTASSCP